MTKAKNEVSLKMKTNPRPPPPSPEFPHFNEEKDIPS